MRTAESVVFTAWPPGPEERIDVEPQLFGADMDVHVFGLREHRHGDRRGVDAPLGFGFRDALHPVDAAFVFEPAVDPVPRDQRR